MCYASFEFQVVNIAPFKIKINVFPRCLGVIVLQQKVYIESMFNIDFNSN